MATIQLETEILHTPGYRACSLAAKALLLDLVELFWHGEGFLVDPQGNPWTLEQLARLTGYSPRELTKGLKELTAGGLLVETADGLLCFPQMAKEVQLHLARQAAGRRGAQRRWSEKKTAAQEIGVSAQTDGKHSKTDGKPDGKPHSKTDGKPDSKPDGAPALAVGRTAGDGAGEAGPGVGRNLNGHKRLEVASGSASGGVCGAPEAAAPQAESAHSPPNTPPREISYGGGGAGEGLEGTGLIGGFRGKEGGREEGERGWRWHALFQAPKIAPKMAPEIPPPISAGGQKAEAPRPMTEAGGRKAEGRESGAEGWLPLPLPPKPPQWAKVEEDWRRLGRYWAGGEPARPRDRKLLWRLLGLAHWPDSPDQDWARAALEAFCDAAGAKQIKNPGAYLERLVRELGRNGRGDVRLLLRQVDTPDWVQRPAERSRSPPASRQPTPLLDLAETAERAALAAQWRQMMAQLRTDPRTESGGPRRDGVGG